MKKILLKALVMWVIVLATVIFDFVQANAEWKHDSHGWWYTKGNTYLKNCSEKIGDTNYYFDSNGYLRTGWIKDKYDIWHYYYQNGTMAKDTTIDGCYIAKQGNMLENITKEDVNKYIKLIEENFPEDTLFLELTDHINTAKNFKIQGYDIKIPKAIVFRCYETSKKVPIEDRDELRNDLIIFIDLDTNEVYRQREAQNVFKCSSNGADTIFAYNKELYDDKAMKEFVEKYF